MQDFKFQAKRLIRSVLKQTHDKDFDALVLPELRASDNHLFLDVGANRGESIQSILMRRPDAKVVAFEPNSILMDKIGRLYKDDPRVSIQNIGLGSEEGVFDLFIPFYNNFMFDGLASFKERRARRWLENRLYGFNKNKLTIKKVSCEVKRLDDLNLAPFFIKIDAQGFEYDILRGGEKTLRTYKPILLIETPEKEELEFLGGLGYEPFIYDGSRLVKGASRDANVFFMPAQPSSGAMSAAQRAFKDAVTHDHDVRQNS